MAEMCFCLVWLQYFKRQNTHLERKMERPGDYFGGTILVNGHLMKMTLLEVMFYFILALLQRRIQDVLKKGFICIKVLGVRFADFTYFS